MTGASLKQKLQARIRAEGPITFHDWMDAALYDPEYGYYCVPDRVRWGREGDYRTSPERTELFAATIARYALELYRELGEPSPWTFLEAGAGSENFALGYLTRLHDLAEKCFNDSRYVIDEKSEASRSSIAKRLGQFSQHMEFCSIETGSAFEGLVFANELLDAFPVHRVTLQDGELQEYFVTNDDKGAFHWTLGNLSTDRLRDYFRRIGTKPAEGQLVDVNLDIEDWLELVGEKLLRGFLIAIDYGAEAHELLYTPLRQKGTLRAIRRHRFVPDILTNPGEQDLTTSVDWTYVRRVAEECDFRVKEFLSQDKFLLKHGLLEELEHCLSEEKNEAEKARTTAEAREMILPNGMAGSFQVLVLAKR